MICQHRFKFSRQSKVLYNRQELIVDVYKCIICEEIRIIDTKTGNAVSMDDAMGKEV